MKLPDADLPPSSEPVLVSGDVEAEARGLVYGAMVFEVHPGCSTEPHSHSSEEIWLIREGVGRATVGDHGIDLAVGTRVTVPPEVRHVITNTSDQPLKVMAFWWREAVHGG